MLSWVVKVVPQPPEPPPKKVEDQKEVKPEAPPPAPPPVVEKKVKFQDEVKVEAPKAENPKPEVQAAPENGPVPGSQAGVLTWISSALPQPAVSPKLSRANSTASEEAAPASSKPEDEKGMIAWISQGLEKVVPQPDLKAKETPAAEQPAEVQVCQKAAPPPPPPPPPPPAEPQILVVEVESDREDSRPAQPSMMEWIKHGIEKVVPQPEIHVRSKTDGNQKTETPAAAKAEAPAAPAASKPNTETEKSTKEAEQPPNMMGWIVSGIGRMLPQPVQKPETGSDNVQTRGKGGQSPLK